MTLSHDERIHDLLAVPKALIGPRTAAEHGLLPDAILDIAVGDRRIRDLRVDITANIAEGWLVCSTTG